VEDRALGGVQILGLLALRDGAAAEPDDTTARVLDREHDTTAQEIVVSARATTRQETGALPHLGRDVPFAERRDREIPTIRRPADAEALDRIRVETAL
jgi:hypothetical protein